MRAKYQILFYLLSLSLFGCSLMPNELKTAERLIESNPDSALNILRHISPDKYRTDANRALYGLLLIETLDKKLLPLKPDSLIDFSTAYYQEHPDKNRLTKCYLYKGRAYKYSFQYEKAMNYFLKALDEAQTSENNTLMGRINFDLGDINSIQGDFALARQKYNIAHNYFLKDKVQLQAFYSLLFVGRTFYQAKDYKKAQNYYQSMLSQAKDSIQRGALYQEMGLNFFESKQLDSALIYYRKVIKYPYIGTNKAIRFNLLAELYFELKDIDSSYFYASNAFKYQPPIRTQRECYRIMTNCKFIKGDLNKVTLYMNRYVELSDSIRKIDAQAKGSYMETMHSTYKEATKNRHLVWYLVVFILIILSCSYLFYILFSKKNTKEKKHIQESNNEEKVVRLKRVVNKKRTLLLQQIQKIKLEQSTNHKPANQEERYDQIKQIYIDLLHIDDQIFFFREMDVVLNNLVSKLQGRFSEINSKELTWCCLCLLKISTHDMLILLDYKTDNSLKGLKKRLSEKFNLDNAALLGDFLYDILSED